MSEHKIQRHKIARQVAEEWTKRASDEGRVLELGWIAMLAHVIPIDAPDTQVSEMRKAFFMGAEHLFGSIMSILDPGMEPTERDLERMTLIHNELETFRKQVTSPSQPGHG